MSYQAVWFTCSTVSFNVSIQSICAATDHSDEEVEVEYEQLETVISNKPQNNILIVIRSFNANIVNTENDDQTCSVLGKYEFGKRNRMR